MLPALSSFVLSLAAISPSPVPAETADHAWVRGVTISCQTWGQEWGTDVFASELDDLVTLGANWVAIHPYAFLRRDGNLTWHDLDPENPPEWLARPVREARERGMALFVKPHIGYWGSGFSWRGEIDFPEPEARARFFEQYREWITLVAACTPDAAAFAVGTELALLNRPQDDAAWRAIVKDVRAVTAAQLTYAANWDVYRDLTFWDALDAVGVQGYFPLSAETEPDVAEIRAGWERVVTELRGVHERTGKPIVFTELGYDAALAAASRPWEGDTERGAERPKAEELQCLCLRVGLEMIEREREWLRGAFLWKWFPGDVRRANFLLDVPHLRAEMRRAWSE